MKSKVLKVVLNPSKVAFLKFVLEGYDHLASLTVVKKGCVEVYTHEKNLRDVISILNDLSEKLSIQKIQET